MSVRACGGCVIICYVCNFADDDFFEVNKRKTSRLIRNFFIKQHPSFPLLIISLLTVFIYYSL